MLVKWFAKYKVDPEESEDNKNFDRAPSFAGEKGSEDQNLENEFDGNVAERHERLVNH